MSWSDGYWQSSRVSMRAAKERGANTLCTVGTLERLSECAGVHRKKPLHRSSQTSSRSPLLQSTTITTAQYAAKPCGVPNKDLAGKSYGPQFLHTGFNFHMHQSKFLHPKLCT